MDRMFLILVRLAITAVGFALAAFAAAMVIVYGAGFRWSAPAEVSRWESFEYLLAAALFVTLFVGMLAFIPAFIIIIVTEVKAIRSPLVFLGGGGMTGLGLALWFFASPGDGAAESAHLGVFASAGIVAGLVYWLIAGRHAGEGIVARPSPPPPSPPTSLAA